MNETLRAVVIEVSGGNIRNHHINLRGALGLFPDDCLGGSNGSTAAKPVTVLLGAEEVETDIDESKAIFRAPGALGRFFEAEGVQGGDLVLVERLEKRSFRVSKASKRGFNFYL